MLKKTCSNYIIKPIMILGIMITTISLYLLLSIDVPTKPLIGREEGGGGAQIGGGFKLIDQNNNHFDGDSLKGKLTLIYFGFTYCPDTCSTLLDKITEVFQTLDKYKIPANFVFITIDPQRDTPTILKNYLQHFNPNFIGLTGSEEQIRKVADKFRVYYVKIGEGDEYMMDHNSFIYLINAKGEYIKHFYLNSSPAEIVEFVRVAEQNEQG